MKANRAFFSDEAFRARLKDNPRVETLVKDRNIDGAGVDAELASVSKADSPVAKLHFLRNKNVAHTDAELVKNRR